VAPGDGNGVGPVSRILHLDPDTVRGRLRGFGGTGPAPVDPAACPEREAIAESVTDSFRVITHDGYRMVG